MSDQTTGGSSTASTLLDSAKSAAGEALGEARTRAGEVASRTVEAAKTEGWARAEGAKDGLADQGERLAASLRGALDGGDDSIQAKLMAAAADSVTDLSNSLRAKSFEQLVGDAGDFAKRNPGAFVAAAAFVGFAVARFARASAPAARSYADIEGTGLGSTYGSPRPTGQGYAGGAGGYAGTSQSQAQGGTSAQSQGGLGGQGYGAGRVRSSSLSTREGGFEDSSVEATPDADGQRSPA